MIMPNLSLNQAERNIAGDNTIKSIRNLFQSQQKNDNDIKDKIFRDVRFLFESSEEDYYKPIRTSNAFSSN